MTTRQSSTEGRNGSRSSDVDPGKSLLGKLRRLVKRYDVGAKFRLVDSRTIEIVKFVIDHRSLRNHDTRFADTYPAAKSVLNLATRLLDKYRFNAITTPPTVQDASLFDWYGFRDEGDDPWRLTRKHRAEVEAGWAQVNRVREL